METLRDRFGTELERQKCSKTEVKNRRIEKNKEGRKKAWGSTELQN